MKIELTQVKQPQGVIIYRGPSMINGKPIVVVATGLKITSDNIKTGSMVQVYILVDGTDPVKAIYSGEDEAVCGNCPHRRVGGAGTCYVNPAHGPGGVYRAIINESYSVMTPTDASKLVEGRIVRIGSYGDPAAVPMNVWDEFLTLASGWTGYTHQWRKTIAKGLQKYCMASVETEKQREYASKKGWRTFRIREDANDELLKGEVQCPASEEAGKKKTCVDCKACSGGAPMKASIAIIAHGTLWKKQRLPKMIQMLKQKKRMRVA